MGYTLPSPSALSSFRPPLTSRRGLPLLGLLLTTVAFLTLLGLHGPSASSSFGGGLFSAASRPAVVDDSSWDFDPNAADHAAFCRGLSDRPDFVDALAAQAATHAADSSSSAPLAPSISASALIARTLALPPTGPSEIPMIIHQSWKNHAPPPMYDALIRSWRATYPNAVYVLWNDTENQMLVDELYPELRDVYAGFGAEIFKADFIRNLYMHAFGGIYGDLDSEALQPLSPLFTSLTPYFSSRPLAFLGSMHTATYHSHSVPNAFMASAPGHPFWLAGPVERAKLAFAEGRHADPEHLTGPVALKETWEDWQTSGRAAGEGEVKLLDDSVIYPYSWDARSEVQECVCWAKSATFSAPMCKLLYPASYTINYWKHSW